MEPHFSFEHRSPLTLALCKPGLLPYAEAWELQRGFVQARSRGEICDTLILLQHPHTYTIGRSGHKEHLLVDAETLERQGVALFESDRGGDITYHGPGQIVGYPILKLAQHGGDLMRYLRLLEEVIIQMLADYQINATRIPGLTGVWVGDSKIAAIGVKLSASGVTSHGFALNVAPDLRFFEQIIPCGIRDRGVTSMEQLLGHAPALDRVEQELASQFCALFGVELAEGSGEFSLQR